ncbi:MAG: IS3 family transposase, partial [Bacteroidales bacterium]|nr:IS3 family transposase [Bacteroidales bacterium]
MSIEQQRTGIEPTHPKLSVRRQCELLGLSRSTLYYQPVPETAENLAMMRLIDEEYTRHPFKGSRRMAAWLSQEWGHEVNRKRVQRLMRQMGLEAIYPKPNRSTGSGHKVYPYLL